jgi:hypothetical protein
MLWRRGTYTRYLKGYCGRLLIKGNKKAALKGSFLVLLKRLLFGVGLVIRLVDKL